ncbi:hypothetical protein [Longimicrobium sp.]|uniref:hypothetical protein n=1 Tax=Longimicrobium sp. TaxID=2029185 RepID=UPI002B71EA09|nr:hypothetical protein [Longimicrobium sp.]HSU14554.1 hypothetical protein [Longimicrobium sp.]
MPRRLAILIPLLLAGCARPDAPPPAPARSAAAAPSPVLSAASADSGDDADADTTGPWPQDAWLREKVSAGAGVIAIVRDSIPRRAFRVFVDGGEVLADSAARDVRLLSVTQSFYPRLVAVLEIVPGDSACAAYRVLDVHAERPPLLTRAFGSCGRPALSWGEDVVRMDFPPHGGARPAEAYEYRDTTLARLAAGRREEFPATRGDGDAWRPPSERMSRLRGRLATPDGVLEITRGATEGGNVSHHNTVAVDGRTVLTEEFGLTMEVYALVPRTAAHGTLAVLLREDGGNACEALFRVVEMRLHRPPRLTEEFGSCAAAPTLVTRDGGVRLEFAPYWTHWQEAEPGFRRPPGQAYEYRAGRMVRVPLRSATAGRKGR